MTKRGIKRYLSGGVGLLLSVAAWFLFAPQQLGGAVAYTMISGSSMEPSLSEGDLAITRQQGSYHPGDVVAYHSSALDSVVLHRIVRIEDRHLVLKGDNNDFVDTDKPMASDVIGKEWIRIPGGGDFVGQIRKPHVAATIVALLSAFSLGLFRSKRGKRASHSDGGYHRSRSGVSPGRLLASGEAGERTVAVIGLTSMCLAAVALFGYTRPATETTADKVGYEHRGALTYSADTPPGPVYPDGRVETGDPVFLRVVDLVRVEFAYELASEAPHYVSGDGSLVAELSDTNGWARSFVIDSSVLEGDRLNLAGDLDLARMRVLAERVERLTGVTRESYTLTVTPEIRLDATIAGQEVADAFTPPTSFSLDALQLRYSSEGAQGEPFRPTREAFVEVTHVEPATVSVLGTELSIQALRRLGLVGTIVALVAFVLLAKPLWSRPRDDVARIQARYGARLVPVAHMPHLFGDAIEIVDMDTLVQLAESYERVILHVVEGGRHSYVVEEGGTVYVYRARAGVAYAEAAPPALA